MIKLGIECENIEDPKSRWGVGQVVLSLLEQYAVNTEWQNKFKLYLYFKSHVPEDLALLKNPIFIKRTAHTGSFNIFYHILMPIQAIRDNLDCMFFPAYMLPPLYFKKSIVMLTNDVYYEYKNGNLPFRYKLAYRLFTNWAAKKASKILAISEASKKELVKLYGIKQEKISVAHLGVNPATARSDSQSDNYILYVGQMFPRRHARESILAFKKLAPQFPDLKFILVGKDKYNPPIIGELVQKTNQALGSERIMYHDYIEGRQDIEKLYAGAKLLIYISTHEAFGLPPVESASHGVPVVVKDNDLNHELFQDAAFFVKDENSIDNIADTIKDGLANENKRTYCIQKYQEITSRLTWHNFAQHFFEIIEK